jgi:hypothetical protein
LLGLFFALIVGHTFYLWRPARMHYWQRLALAAVAVPLGELLAFLGILSGIRVGEMHVVTDLAVAVALQFLAQRRPRSTARRPKPSS